MRNYLELLHILGSWLRWSYVLFFFLSVFLLKPGQVLVFAEVCRFLLVTDVQPPLCWRPRKFWTAALFVSRDWYKVFKVQSVGFFQNRVYQKQDIFMRMRTLSSTEKLSKTGSLDSASLRSANVLETTWQKMVSARATMTLSLNFIILVFHLALIENV